MPKKKTSKPRSSKKSPNASSTPLEKLGKLQRKLVDLLQDHADLITTLSGNDPVAAQNMIELLVDDERLEKSMKKSNGPVSTRCIQAICRELASGIRATISKQKVAFLGPLHSYSHLATLRQFGHSAELVAVRTIAAVFEEVSSGHVDAGVVPIENSTDGRIVDTLDMFTRSSVKIAGDLPLRIHHNLLGIGEREDVTEVCSKPQAISQCRDWLATHLPKAKITAVSSTTAAAEQASRDKTVAAIASKQAGVEYGLKVLAKEIEDNPDNITRFAVIAKEPAAKTGNDKTSLMFELSHQPGALADAMMIFKRQKLNLTWIESFPKPNSPKEYLFFVELEGHQKDLRLRKTLAALKKKTVAVEVLGSYPLQAPVE